jgi:hypothetical protein
MVALLMCAVTSARADTPAPTAYLTEIRAKGGSVGVMRPGEASWRPPQPLLALRPGDRLRAEGSARIVVFYHGGEAVTVTAANSPYTVQTIASTGASRQMKVVTDAVSEYFIGRQTPPKLQRAATRGETAVMVEPRYTRLFPGPVTFEWEGPERVRYAVRVSGPDGVVWEQHDLPVGRAKYPDSAPALGRGVQYRWELEAPGVPTQRTPFEVINDADAARIRDELRQVNAQGGLPPATVLVTRTAFLSSQGLFAEARRELKAGIAATPDEPTLHVMLAHVYDHIGLGARADVALARAQALLQR